MGDRRESDSSLSVDECVRAGMYWFGRGDFEAAKAWWDRALELDPRHARALECLKMLQKGQSRGSLSGPSMPSPSPAPSEPVKPAEQAKPIQQAKAKPAEPEPITPWMGRPVLPEAAEQAKAKPTEPEPITPWMGRPVLPEAAEIPRSQLTDTLVPSQRDPGPLPSLPFLESRRTPSVDVVPPRPMSEMAVMMLETGDPPRVRMNSSSDFVKGWDSQGMLPSDDLGLKLPMVAGEDPFSFAEDGQAGASSDLGAYASPWDEGPSRTSVLIVGNDDDDAVAEPTPLPNLDRDQFFGRPDPTSKEEIRAYLRATGDLSSIGAHTADLLSTQASSESVPEHPLSTAKRLYQLHDFRGAIEQAGAVLMSDPGYRQAQELRLKGERELTRMLESKIGDFDHVPRVLVSSEELIWLNLSHRAGFLLSQIDGSVSYDDLTALSGMTRLDTLDILARLIHDKLIG